MHQIQLLLGLCPIPRLGSSQSSSLLREGRGKGGEREGERGRGDGEREGRGGDPKGLVHTLMSEIVKIGLP